MKDLGNYEVYAETLARATSQQHMADMKRVIDESAARRQVLSESTIGAQSVAGIIDPINLIALPFGGPAVGIGKSALRVGAGTAAIQAGLEGAVIQPFDPLQTAQESAINIATTAIFGAGIGGAFGAPITAKARAHANTQKAIQEEMHTMNDRLDAIESGSAVFKHQVNVLGNILSPTNLDRQSREIAEVKKELTYLREASERMYKMHNGKHGPVS